MARTVNKVTLIGNVGREPESRTTAAGMKVANTSIATSRRPNKDGTDGGTDWHRLVFWDRLAQFATDYVRKGDRLYIEGELRYDTYERDGVAIPIVEVWVREVVLLTSRAKDDDL